MKKFFALMILASVAFVACDKSDDDGPETDPKVIGIVGEWYSSGTNVAPLLGAIGVDSVYAKFESNNTYVVESFSDGSKTTLTGTYVQEKSSNGTIWTIVLNQSTPNTLTSEGIFEISSSATPYTMNYEVAQTNPVITGVTPPTVEGGFGSTSNGAYGNLNIQKYIKIVK